MVIQIANCVTVNIIAETIIPPVLGMFDNASEPTGWWFGFACTTLKVLWNWSRKY